MTLVVGAAALGGSLLPALPVSSAPPTPTAVHTNRSKFRIPFQYDAQEMARLAAVEIQLFVTTDRGKNWQLSQAVPPATGRFTYQAPQQGEYWFAVRTIDAQGQHHPAGPHQAGLQVVVDEIAPTLQVRLQESVPGRVDLSWQAADDYLHVDSLRLEYIDANSSQWQAVGVAPAASGQTSWSVPQGGQVFVRGTVADRAGNTTSADASATIRVGRGNQPQPAKPDFSQPVAVAPQTSMPTLELAAEPVDEPIPQHAPTLVPADRVPTAVLPEIRGLASRGAEPPGVAQRPRDHFISIDPSRSPPLTQDLFEALPGSRSAAAGGRVRRVNSTSFNVGYEFDGVGPSGVSQVDLFITENGGRKWYYYGADEDRRSPFEVTVPADGEYGFALRVRSGVGLAADPPQPGDGPEMVVLIDRTPPQVKLFPIRQGQGPAQQQVAIEWQVQDEQLAARPVALSWSGQPNGPWEPITGWQENTGRFTWTIGRHLPQKVYVRLEARDAAGNVARTDVDQPLVVDLSHPTARILDVESVKLLDPQ
jgi:hypothetical protein